MTERANESIEEKSIRLTEERARKLALLDEINQPSIVTPDMSTQERAREYLKVAESRFSGGTYANRESYLELLDAVKEISKFLFGESEEGKRNDNQENQ